MTGPIPTLEAIGFDAHFQGQVAALGGDLVPARIAIAHGESYIAWTERGPCKAVLSGSRAGWKEAIHRPQVGDWVAGNFLESLDAFQVAHLLERRTCLIRQASGKRPEPQVIAANIDVVGIVSAFGEGKSARERRLINEPLVRRYLAVAEQSRAQPILIVNKIDLSADPQAVTEPFAQTFPGVPVVLTSALTGLGLDGLGPWLPAGKTLALIGMSGVGKSTLVNALVGRSTQRTGEVRESDARGRHTTTHRELIVMASGALLIDTPGMRELGVWEMEVQRGDQAGDQGVGHGFEDVQAIAASCRFGDCRHATEPGCAIREALATGRLSSEHWANYQKQGHKPDDSQGRGPRRGKRSPYDLPGRRKG
jgi:ribosome biogenesis GTPase / thiamine phosphate phosphatase